MKDIHSVLELTVFDEDPNNKFEFLGKVAIPLLKVYSLKLLKHLNVKFLLSVNLTFKIRNSEKRWYALKDKKLHRRAKGQILLEFELFWNPVLF